VLPLSPSTVNGAAEYGLGKDSRKGKMFCRTAQFWCRTLQMEQEKLLIYSNDWQIGNIKWQS
jgi:hypothetical protein